VRDPSVPICTDGVCSIPGLPEYGGPTAGVSSVKLLGVLDEWLAGRDWVMGADYTGNAPSLGAVAELVGIEGGVVSGVTNLESSGVEPSDWRPRHDEPYHEA
jgi:hypothetical protein